MAANLLGQSLLEREVPSRPTVLCVASLAERDEVAEIIRLAPVSEVPEGANVVNLKALLLGSLAAALAALIIPLSCAASLASPVRAIVRLIAAAPRWMMRRIGSHPFIPADSGAVSRLGACGHTETPRQREGLAAVGARAADRRKAPSQVRLALLGSTDCAPMFWRPLMLLHPLPAIVRRIAGHRTKCGRSTSLPECGRIDIEVLAAGSALAVFATMSRLVSTSLRAPERWARKQGISRSVERPPALSANPCFSIPWWHNLNIPRRDKDM